MDFIDVETGQKRRMAAKGDWKHNANLKIGKNLIASVQGASLLRSEVSLTERF